MRKGILYFADVMNVIMDYVVRDFIIQKLVVIVLQPIALTTRLPKTPFFHFSAKIPLYNKKIKTVTATTLSFLSLFILFLFILI